MYTSDTIDACSQEVHFLAGGLEGKAHAAAGQVRLASGCYFACPYLPHTAAAVDSRRSI